MFTPTLRYRTMRPHARMNAHDTRAHAYSAYIHTHTHTRARARIYIYNARTDTRACGHTHSLTHPTAATTTTKTIIAQVVYPGWRASNVEGRGR